MSENKAAAKNTAPAADAAKAGPNKPQLRILAALAKAKKPLTKEQLVAASGVTTNWIAEYAGQPGSMVSDLVNGKGPLKLNAAGLIKITMLTDEAAKGERLYEIKPAGRKALERAEKSAAAK